MQQPLHVAAAALGCLVSAFLGAFLALQFAGGASPEEEGGAGLRASLRRLEGEVSAMREERAGLARELAALRSAGVQGPRRTPDWESVVAGAVEDYFAKQGRGAATARESAGRGDDGAWSEEERTELLHASVRRFLDPMLAGEEREEIWQRIREAGMVQEAIARLEAEVAASPHNADLRVELGYAYQQPIIAGEVTGPEAGVWAKKADDMYDEALERNPRHWEARFQKAVSLSYWPPVLGRQGEAIDHFETLVDQQRDLPPEPRHAETHLMLGNLHRQAGDLEAARAAWERGLTAFPDNEGLQQALGDG